MHISLYPPLRPLLKGFLQRLEAACADPHKPHPQSEGRILSYPVPLPFSIFLYPPLPPYFDAF